MPSRCAAKTPPAASTFAFDMIGHALNVDVEQHNARLAVGKHEVFLGARDDVVAGDFAKLLSGHNAGAVYDSLAQSTEGKRFVGRAAAYDSSKLAEVVNFDTMRRALRHPAMRAIGFDAAVFAEENPLAQQVSVLAVAVLSENGNLK